MCSSLLIIFLLSLLQLQLIITLQQYDPKFSRFAFELAAAAYSKNLLKCPENSMTRQSLMRSLQRSGRKNSIRI